jgi:hypothetical protein
MTKTLVKELSMEEENFHLEGTSNNQQFAGSLRT